MAVHRRAVDRLAHLRDACGFHRAVGLVEIEAFLIPLETDEIDQLARRSFGVGDDVLIDHARHAVDAQLAKRRAADFARLDTDRDGRLTPAEYSAGTPIAPRRKADPDAVVMRMDADKDRKVSAAEFRAPSLATFDKLDVNGDGIAAIDEQRKARRAGR